jgi:hypothetical protein
MRAILVRLIYNLALRVNTFNWRRTINILRRRRIGTAYVCGIWWNFWSKNRAWKILRLARKDENSIIKSRGGIGWK